MDGTAGGVNAEGARALRERLEALERAVTDLTRDPTARERHAPRLRALAALVRDVRAPGAARSRSRQNGRHAALARPRPLAGGVWPGAAPAARPGAARPRPPTAPGPAPAGGSGGPGRPRRRVPRAG